MVAVRSSRAPPMDRWAEALTDGAREENKRFCRSCRTPDVPQTPSVYENTRARCETPASVLTTKAYAPRHGMARLGRRHGRKSKLSNQPVRPTRTTNKYTLFYSLCTSWSPSSSENASTTGPSSIELGLLALKSSKDDDDDKIRQRGGGVTGR